MLNQQPLYIGNAGNQRTRPNKVSNRTTDLLQSPVTPKELADFLSIDYCSDDSTLISSLLLSATQACINYTNIELLEREYTYIADRPIERQAGYIGVGMMHAYRAWWVDLPIYPVLSVDSVLVNDEPAEYEADLLSRPARIEIDNLGRVEITYRAGHASPYEIDAQLLLGIKMLAGFLFEHRGACDAAGALSKSGAAALWNESRIITNL